jgi:hypothetical protein
VALAVPSLEGASGQSVDAGCFADGAGQDACCRLLLTVSDRQLPVLRARGGHGRCERPRLQPVGDGYQLGRWAMPVQGDTSLVGKPSQRRGSCLLLLDTAQRQPHGRTEITEAQGSHPTEASR